MVAIEDNTEHEPIAAPLKVFERLLLLAVGIGSISKIFSIARLGAAADGAVTVR
jgi:hypothetical protein